MNTYRVYKLSGASEDIQAYRVAVTDDGVLKFYAKDAIDPFRSIIPGYSDVADRAWVDFHKVAESGDF